MKDKSQKIRAIAKQVRKQCEIFAHSEDAKKYQFYLQNDLACMCAVASYTLATKLREHKISCKMISGTWGNSEHCWVETNGYIVDITASQFGLSDVYIPRNRNKYSSGKLIKTYRQIRWGKDQSPHPKLAKKILEIKA